MTPGLLITIGGIAFVIGIIVVVINMASGINKASNAMETAFDAFESNGSLSGRGAGFLKSAGGTFIRHLLGGLLASVGGTVAVGGFIWFLVEKFAS